MANSKFKSCDMPREVLDGCVSRRDFLDRCLSAARGVTIVAVLAPVAAACDTVLEPKDPSSGHQNDDGAGGDGVTFDVQGLTTDGTGAITNTRGPDSYPIMIVRVAAGQYVALSIRCTHQGCDVNAPSEGAIRCPCHGSKFGLDGSVLNGPAAEPLDSYPLTYDPDSETVTVTVQ